MGDDALRSGQDQAGGLYAKLAYVDQERIIQSLRGYFEERPDLGVASVYLFGSHAKGTPHRESDIDVAVLLRWDRYLTRDARFEARISLTSELISVLHHNEVDLVVLNEAPAPLGRQIIYEGIQVYLGDPATDHAYVRDVQILAADMEPWLKWTRKLRLEALAR